MAFTVEEREKIRKYLGYPNVYIYANPRLENAIDLVGQSATLVADVQDILADLVKIKLKFGNNIINTAGLKRAEDIEWYGDSSENVETIVSKVGEMLCGQLSVIFGVPINVRIFSGAGYDGDAWKKNNGNSHGPFAGLKFQ